MSIVSGFLSAARSRIGRPLVRWRYVILLVETVTVFVPQYLVTTANRTLGEWYFFLAGAEGLTHGTPGFGAPALHLYVNNPNLQIGPPPLELVAVIQHYTTPTQVEVILATVMALVAVVLVRLFERIGLAMGADGQRVRSMALLGGLVVVGLWVDQSAQWRHLDDVMALSATAFAVSVILRVRAGLSGRLAAWWLAPLLLGLAAASKPWALVFAPLLLGLPRPKWVRAAGILIISAAIWWAPFVIAAPDTITALGRQRLYPAPGSVPYLFGLRGDTSHWLRSAQFALGLAAAFAIGLRRSWLAVPVVALAVRVATDPFVWPYYGMGYLLLALAVDLWRRQSRRGSIPWACVVTAVVFYALPALTPVTVAALGRLAWGVAAVVLALCMTPDGQEIRADALPVRTSTPSWLRVRIPSPMTASTSSAAPTPQRCFAFQPDRSAARVDTRPSPVTAQTRRITSKSVETMTSSAPPCGRSPA